jgi:lysophospholipase L1-like esterase
MMVSKNVWGMCAAIAAVAAWTVTVESTAHAADGLKTGERIVFLGDSITQAGASEDGFVTLIRKALDKQPELKAEVIGAGISGNRVPDLQARLDRDVIAKKPTLVVIYIGINDVWHWANGRGTTKEDYEKGLNDVIDRITKAGGRVVLCTPSVIGEKPSGNDMDKQLDEYSEISRKVAKAKNLAVIDLRKKFVAYEKDHNEKNQRTGVLTTDGVHLNKTGNKFVADVMLAALTGTAKGGAHAAKEIKVLRHIVMFKFKDSSSKEDVAKCVAAFGELPGKIKEIAGFEWGTNNSPEGKADGFTHCFTVTFKSAKDRDAYLPHAAHQAFIKIAGPHIEKVLVMDYWAEK